QCNFPISLMFTKQCSREITDSPSGLVNNWYTVDHCISTSGSHQSVGIPAVIVIAVFSVLRLRITLHNIWQTFRLPDQSYRTSHYAQSIFISVGWVLVH
ncbi:hypothetical protein EWB00_006987, partial [Schistosoma japonicum]